MLDRKSNRYLDYFKAEYENNKRFAWLNFAVQGTLEDDDRILTFIYGSSKIHTHV